MTTIYMLTSQSHSQMMSFVVKSDNHLIVIDGGNTCDADYLSTYLQKLGGVIDAWFITHLHRDHIDALSSILDRHLDKLTINAVYYNFPPDDFIYAYKRNDDDYNKAIRLRRLLTEKGVVQKTPHKGDLIDFGDLSMQVLREPDLSMTIEDVINNTSVVYRLESDGKSMLFLGDLSPSGGRQLLATVPHELIKADFVQMAHHGQKGVDRDVYDVVKPDYCFWCTPAWLWDNDAGKGYDTHEWKTIVTRGWMSDIGVKWHYVSKDGTHEVPMTEERP